MCVCVCVGVCVRVRACVHACMLSLCQRPSFRRGAILCGRVGADVEFAPVFLRPAEGLATGLLGLGFVRQLLEVPLGQLPDGPRGSRGGKLRSTVSWARGGRENRHFFRHPQAVPRRGCRFRDRFLCPTHAVLRRAGRSQEQPQQEIKIATSWGMFSNTAGWDFGASRAPKTGPRKAQTWTTFARNRGHFPGAKTRPESGFVFVSNTTGPGPVPTFWARPRAQVGALWRPKGWPRECCFHALWFKVLG